MPSRKHKRRQRKQRQERLAARQERQQQHGEHQQQQEQQEQQQRQLQQQQQQRVAEQESVPDGRETPPLETPEDYFVPEILDSLPEALDELVLKLRPKYVPESLLDPQVRYDRLKEVLFSNFERMKWFTVPFWEALAGDTDINARIATPFDPGAEPNPVLYWLVQWKLMRKQFGYRGADDMVHVALKLGANPNIRLKNGTNSLFFATKYSSPHCVDLLIEAGADVTAKDIQGRTCLFNALEHPNKRILGRLLEHLPASELFESQTKGGTVVHLSLADRILNLFSSETLLEGGGQLACPISWKIIGRPSVLDMAESLALVWRKGALFRQENMDALGAMVPGIAPLPAGYSTRNFHDSKEAMEKIAQMLIGSWLPESLAQEVRAFDLHREDVSHEAFASAECPICLHKISERNKIRLYCKHIFCIDCITEYGGRESSQPPSCPCCRRLLCRDICGPSMNAVRRISIYQLLGDRSAGLTDRTQFLSDEQVKQESQARGISTRSKSVDSLRRDIRITNERYSHVELELGSTRTMTMGETIIMAPKDGAALIPIVLKSVPLLAYISTRSLHTAISPQLVELFGLKKLGLTSKKFRDYSGRKANTTATALEELEFMFGPIKVALNTAIEVNLPQHIGIQLGLDFFMASAMW